MGIEFKEVSKEEVPTGGRGKGKSYVKESLKNYLSMAHSSGISEDVKVNIGDRNPDYWVNKAREIIENLNAESDLEITTSVDEGSVEKAFIIRTVDCDELPEAEEVSEL